jgi:hypothetical protein
MSPLARQPHHGMKPGHRHPNHLDTRIRHPNRLDTRIRHRRTTLHLGTRIRHRRIRQVRRRSESIAI